MVKSIYIMAGGPENHVPTLTHFEVPAIWVGVDKGITTLLAMGITPNVVFGDFDSIHPEDLAFIKKTDTITFQYPSEKDDTDLVLAVQWAIQQQPERICIFGSTGGRMDHSLGSIGILLTEQALTVSTNLSIIDKWNMIYAVPPGVHFVQQQEAYKYISFFSMSPTVTNLTLEGFKYPLKNKTIALGSSLCVSNELISERGHFSFSSGILLVVRSNDNCIR